MTWTNMTVVQLVLVVVSLALCAFEGEANSKALAMFQL